MSRALVTGATGMVGRHIAQRLLADGWTVRALVRDAARARTLSELGVDVVVGDVLDAAAFTRAAVGVEVIFHAAAEIIVSGGWDAFRAVNVGGTENAVAAAAATHARLLQVSSVAVYGAAGRYLGAREGKKTSEDTPLLPLHEHAYYARSKRESENLVMAAHQSGKIWGAAIRPDVVYGPYDRQFVPRIARILRLGVMPLLAGGRAVLAIVHAANVADAAVRAATSDRAGGRVYNVANDFNVTAREFFTYGADGLDRRLRFVPLPIAVARGAIRAFRIATGGRFNVAGSATVDFLARDNPFTSDRAREELQWSPRVSPPAGVREAFAWWSAEQKRR